MNSRLRSLLWVLIAIAVTIGARYWSPTGVAPYASVERAERPVAMHARPALAPPTPEWVLADCHADTIDLAALWAALPATHLWAPQREAPEETPRPSAWLFASPPARHALHQQARAPPQA